MIGSLAQQLCRDAANNAARGKGSSDDGVGTDNASRSEHDAGHDAHIDAEPGACTYRDWLCGPGALRDDRCVRIGEAVVMVADENAVSDQYIGSYFYLADGADHGERTDARSAGHSDYGTGTRVQHGVMLHAGGSGELEPAAAGNPRAFADINATPQGSVADPQAAQRLPAKRPPLLPCRLHATHPIGAEIR
jgi:hypothetical protein